MIHVFPHLLSHFLQRIIKRHKIRKSVFILYFKAHTISCSGIILREKLARNQRWHLKTSKSTLLLICGRAEHLPFDSFKLNSEKEKAHKKA